MLESAGALNSRNTSLTIGANGLVGQRGFNNTVSLDRSSTDRSSSFGGGGVSNFVAPNLTVPDASSGSTLTDDVIQSLRSEPMAMNTSTSDYVMGTNMMNMVA